MYVYTLHTQFDNYVNSNIFLVLLNFFRKKCSKTYHKHHTINGGYGK